MQLTVHQVSKELNVSVDTVRRWDKKGLIKSVRSENNYRLFDLEEVDRINKKFNGVSNNINNYKILQSYRKTNYKVIELFAGAGGTSLGFENAGLNHAFLNEIDKNAVATLKENFGEGAI